MSPTTPPPPSTTGWPTTPRCAGCWARRPSASRPPCSSSPRRTSPRRPCWPPPARSSPTSTPRAIPVAATTAATRSSTRSRTWPADRLTALFGAEHANVQPHAGANANLAVYQALLEPGDTILAMRLDHGGHLTHGSPASITSKIWRFVSYGVSPATGDPDKPGEIIDFDQVADVARRERPKLIVAGSTAYSRIIDPLPVPRDRRLGRGPVHVRRRPPGRPHRRRGPPLAGGGGRRGHLHHPQDPARPAGRGHRLLAPSWPRRSTARSSPGSRAARSSTSSRPRRWPSPRRPGPSSATTPPRWWPTPPPSATPWPTPGFRLVSGGTENHQVLVDLRTFDAELTGKVAQEVLDRAGITCNRNTIPDDPRSPFVTSGLRLGSAAQTTAGMGPAEMRTDRRADRPHPAPAGTTRRRPAGARPRCASCAPASRPTRPWPGRDPRGGRVATPVSSGVPLNWYAVLLVVAARVVLGPHLPGPPHRRADRLRGPARRPQGAPAGDPAGRRGGHVRGPAGHLGGGRVDPGAQPRCSGGPRSRSAWSSGRRPSSWSGSSTTSGTCRPRPRWPARCWRPPSSTSWG